MAPTKPVAPQYQLTVSVNLIKPARGAKNKSVVEQERIDKNIRYTDDEGRSTSEVHLTVNYDAGSGDFVDQKLVDSIKRGIQAAMNARVEVEDASEEGSEDEIPEEAMPPLVKGKKAANTTNTVIVDAKKGTTTSKGKKKTSVKFEDENNNQVEEHPVRRTLRSDKDKKLVPDLAFAKGQRAI